MDRFNFPIGVIVDALAVVIGGTIGAAAGKKLKEDFKENMNLILRGGGAEEPIFCTLPINIASTRKTGGSGCGL